MNDDWALIQIENALEPLKRDLEACISNIKIQLVGRLIRPKAVHDLLYEVQDFNENSSEIKIRRLLDQNGIMLSQRNDNRSNFKFIRGSVLNKQYDTFDLDEEFKIRQEIFAKSKLIIKYQVIKVDD